MKFFMLILAVLFMGCGAPDVVGSEKYPAEMTEAERTAEIQAILDKVGVKLPTNWESMSKEERGIFLLPILMEANMEE